MIDGIKPSPLSKAGSRPSSPASRQALLNIRVPALAGRRIDIIVAIDRLFDQDVAPRLHDINLALSGLNAIRELCLNVAMHGGGGMISLNLLCENGRRSLEVVAEDNGPGIADLGALLEQSRRSQAEADENMNSSSPRRNISGMGTYIICLRPDSVEVESRGLRWIRTWSGELQASPCPFRAGSWFRLLFNIS